MKFNEIEKDFVTVLRGRERPAWSTNGLDKIVRVPIKIDHEIVNDLFTDLHRKKEDMAEWLIHDDYKHLEFMDEPDRFYLAKIYDEMSLEEFSYWAEGTISFECKEKYSHERTITIDTTATETIKGHTSTPWRTLTLFSANQTGYELEFNSPGENDLREINKIVLNYNFIQGDVLEIDYSKRKVTLNGVDRSNILVILQSNYMELPIGEVEFVVNHETEFYYNERYY